MTQPTFPMARLIGRRIGMTFDRLLVRMALGAGVALCFALGLASGLTGLWFALVPLLGPARASAALAAGLFLAAILLLLAIRLLGLSWARRDAAAKAAAEHAIASGGTGMASLMLGIIALGFAAGQAGK